MKKILLLSALLVSSAYAAGNIIVGGSSGTGKIIVNGGASSGGGGGSGGSSALQVTQSGVQITSPTASMNFFGSDFQLQANGSTSTIALNPNTTDFIHLTSSLQSGATFFVSSGTVSSLTVGSLNSHTLANNDAISFSSGTGGQGSCPTPTVGKTFMCVYDDFSLKQSTNGAAYVPIAGLAESSATSTYLQLSSATATYLQASSATATYQLKGSYASLSSTNTWTAQQIFGSSSTFNGGVYISSTILLSGSPGTNGQFLTSGGNGTVPTWTTSSGSGDMVLASTQTSTGSKTFKNNSDSSAGPVIITSTGTGNVLQVNASGAFGTSDGSSGGALFSCNDVQSQGPCVQLYSNQGLQSSLTAPFYLVQNNTAADNPNIYVVAKGTSPQNGIRIDGSDYSTLALIDTLRSASSKNGKFQFSSHNNELRAERRNSANNSFESAFVIDSSTGVGVMFVGTDYSRPVSTMDVAGAVGIGTAVAGITAAPLNGLLVQGNIRNQALTASLPVQTNSTKDLVSLAIDLSGTQATGALAAGRFPALTGDVTTSAGALATTLAPTQTAVHTWTSSNTYTNVVKTSSDVYVTTGSAVGFDEYQNGAYVLTSTITWQNGNKQAVTLTANTTFNFIAPDNSGNLILRIATGAGSFTGTWPGSVKWSGGSTPTITATASKVDIIACYYSKQLATYYCAATQNF